MSNKANKKYRKTQEKIMKEWGIKNAKRPNEKKQKRTIKQLKKLVRETSHKKFKTLAEIFPPL